jgi:hypothetical protein
VRLKDRVERIEQLLKGRHSTEGEGGGGPTVIRIYGGLDTEPRATIGRMTIECAAGESVDAFEERAFQRAISENASFVIFGGMPRWVR